MENKVVLKELPLFELKSWIGRKFINNSPKLNIESNY